MRFAVLPRRTPTQRQARQMRRSSEALMRTNSYCPATLVYPIRGRRSPAQRIMFKFNSIQSASFNIGGTGRAAAFDASNQYNINGNRVLSNSGTNNFFAGQGAGQVNSTGASNAFFGENAGQTNDVGTSNSFFGSSAGLSNSNGNFNAFFGTSSGRSNVDGHNNAFFGFTTGRTTRAALTIHFSETLRDLIQRQEVITHSAGISRAQTTRPVSKTLSSEQAPARLTLGRI